ncbi:MAG: glycosyltransferase [Planctomycetes bacterium]|nr:glycosyltransferase [Planctomycetota bacterium]MCW8136730.1 glycosyltransferase [Planctomycetota bacterium]
MRVAFAHHEPIDAAKARWVAIVRSLAAMAEVADVTWLTPDTAARTQAYARDHLGLALPAALRVQTLPSVHKLAGLTINHVFFRACGRALEKQPPDVLWLRSDKLAAHLASRPPAPLVYEAHLVGPLWAADNGRGERASKRLEQLERRLYGAASGVAAITQGLLDEIRARYGYGGPAAVTPSAVDTAVFRPVFNAGGQTVVYVGTLQFWKGLSTLLEAMALAPGLRLRIVGGGDDHALRERAAALGIAGRVEITGRVPQTRIPALCADALCAVHPLPPEISISARFTSPLKLFEYMAMGLPIVAADVPSAREVLNDGNARLYKAGDAAALATALQQLAGDAALAARLSQGGLATAQLHTYQARAKRLLDLFAQASG